MEFSGSGTTFSGFAESLAFVKSSPQLHKNEETRTLIPKFTGWSSASSSTSTAPPSSPAPSMFGASNSRKTGVSGFAQLGLDYVKDVSHNEDAEKPLAPLTLLFQGLTAVKESAESVASKAQDRLETTQTGINRYIYFAVSSLIGCLLILLALFFLPMVVLSPQKFALLFTMGSLFIMNGLGLLKGYRSLVTHLMRKDRLLFSLAYFGCIVLTLYATLKLRSYFLVLDYTSDYYLQTLIFAALQMAFLILLLISYAAGPLLEVESFDELKPFMMILRRKLNILWHSIKLYDFWDCYFNFYPELPCNLDYPGGQELCKLVTKQLVALSQYRSDQKLLRQEKSFARRLRISHDAVAEKESADRATTRRDRSKIPSRNRFASESFHSGNINNNSIECLFKDMPSITNTSSQAPTTGGASPSSFNKNISVSLSRDSLPHYAMQLVTQAVGLPHMTGTIVTSQTTKKRLALPTAPLMSSVTSSSQIEDSQPKISSAFQKSLSPPQQSVLPRQRSLSPPQQFLSPHQQFLSPPQQFLSPRQRFSFPLKQSILPPQQSFFPPQKSSSPSQQSKSRSHQSLAPPQESVAAPPPQETSVPPTQEAVVPSSQKSLAPLPSGMSEDAVNSSISPIEINTSRPSNLHPHSYEISSHQEIQPGLLSSTLKSLDKALLGSPQLSNGFNESANLSPPPPPPPEESIGLLPPLEIAGWTSGKSCSSNNMKYLESLLQQCDAEAAINESNNDYTSSGESRKRRIVSQKSSSRAQPARVMKYAKINSISGRKHVSSKNEINKQQHAKSLSNDVIMNNNEGSSTFIPGLSNYENIISPATKLHWLSSDDENNSESKKRLARVATKSRARKTDGIQDFSFLRSSSSSDNAIIILDDEDDCNASEKSNI